MTCFDCEEFVAFWYEPPPPAFGVILEVPAGRCAARDITICDPEHTRADRCWYTPHTEAERCEGFRGCEDK